MPSGLSFGDVRRDRYCGSTEWVRQGVLLLTGKQVKVAVVSGLENATEASVEFTAEAGQVAVVSGTVVSTVHANVAGDASTLPARSVARAFRVCDPSTALRVSGEVVAVY